MLEILEEQIKELQVEEKRALIPPDYGHGIAAIVSAGQLEALLEHSPEAQVAQMKKKAEQQVIKWGPKILDFLKPELRDLILPEDMERLTKLYEENSVK